MIILYIPGWFGQCDISSLYQHSWPRDLLPGSCTVYVYCERGPGDIQDLPSIHCSVKRGDRDIFTLEN